MLVTGAANIMINPRIAAAIAALVGIGFISLGARADEKRDHDNGAQGEDYHRDFIYGVPGKPSEAWQLARGGRLYDNWYATLGQDAPEATHPLWPASNAKKKGAATWRCKSCHGWDYKGAAGAYGKGSYKTGIKGLAHLRGTDPADIVPRFSDKAHRFADVLPKDDLGRLALFVSKGLHDADPVIDRDSKAVKGNEARGQGIFQTICAACHGFDGKALNWGDEKKPAFVATEANANPWEVLHKIRNGHPGFEMIALRAFALQDAVDVLAYAKTLPTR